MGKIILLLSIVFFASCVQQPPEVKYIYETKTVKVPVYKSPIDNETYIEAPNIERFKFSPEGNICLDEDNFKILANDLLLMNNYINKTNKVFNELKQRGE